MSWLSAGRAEADPGLEHPRGLSDYWLWPAQAQHAPPRRGLGKLYRRTGQRDQAQEHLTIATASYREMGMTYWLQQAEAELRPLADRLRG